MRNAFAFAPALLVLTACGPDYDRTDIVGVVSALANGEVSRDRIVVSQGSIVKAHIVSLNDDGKSMSNDITSNRPDTLLVTPVASDHDYAFQGLKPGFATVEIRADGKTVLIIDALVTQQPPLP